MIVKNEERWVWFALKSILPFADRVLVWDTGSTDKTVKAIKSIKNKKIKFRQKGQVSREEFGHLRQKMLEQSQGDWVWIVDGDEVYPYDSAFKLMAYLKNQGNKFDAFCPWRLNFVGDINFIHPESFNDKVAFTQGKLRGTFFTRIFKRKIPGLHIAGTYPWEAFFDQDGANLRSRKDKVSYLKDVYYWHLSYLPRSSSRQKDKQVVLRKNKRKYELGVARPSWVQIPQVFSLKSPGFIADPFYKMSKVEYLRALIQTPLKKIKRKLFK